MPDHQFLEINHLDAGYGRSQVLFDVNVGIPWRGGVAVLGRNGAGKTTLMKTIVGELGLSKGELKFDGRDISRSPTEERVRIGHRLRTAGAFGVCPPVGARQSRRRFAV